jgi:acetolactate synthase-1/2/3 large subunit
MAMMNGGQAAARALRSEGIEVVFGIVGTHNVQIFDGLYDEAELRVVTTRHEQGAGFMADGYARATGRIGAAIVVPGPGLTNLMTALGQAYLDSVPFLALTGQNPSPRLDRELEDFHELRGSLTVAGSVTASAARVRSAAEIPTAIREAVRLMRTTRPRPTFLEIPMDVLGGDQEVELLPPAEDFPRPGGDGEAIRRAAGLLNGARRPLILAGVGVVSAEGSAALREVAEKLGAPVVTTVHGKGAIADDHPLALGDGWGRLDFFDELFAQADACLAVGTTVDYLTDFQQGAKLPDPFIHVDIDPRVIGRVRSVALGIVGDARLVLERLADGLGTDWRGRGWCDVDAARAHKRMVIERAAGPVLGLLDAVRAALPRDAMVADDLCLPGYWAVPALDVYEPRTFFHPGMYGTLGYALPAAIGASIGRPDRHAVALCGDGGFLYTSQELATAVQERVNVTAIVFNDNAFGALKLFQDRHLKGRQIGVDLHNPDFALLAQAYGARGVKLRASADLSEALADAVRQGGPTVIECPLDFDVSTAIPPWMA